MANHSSSPRYAFSQSASSTASYNSALNSMRPMLMQTLRVAVDSGDAATAAGLFQVLAGERAAAQVGPREVLEKVGGWLDAQGTTHYDFLAA